MTETFAVIIHIALFILGFALFIAPLKIWDHIKQLRRESRAAAEQAHKNAYVIHQDLKALLAAINTLTAAFCDATPESN